VWIGEGAGRLGGRDKMQSKVDILGKGGPRGQDNKPAIPHKKKNQHNTKKQGGKGESHNARVVAANLLLSGGVSCVLKKPLRTFRTTRGRAEWIRKDIPCLFGRSALAREGGLLSGATIERMGLNLAGRKGVDKWLEKSSSYA